MENKAVAGQQTVSGRPKLYRTRFIPSNLTVNISPNLNTLLSHYIISVDRVSFSVKFKYIQLVKVLLDERYQYAGYRRKDSRNIWSYYYGDSLIQLVRYPNNYWFSVTVHDVAHNLWCRVLDTLLSVVDWRYRDEAVILSQCELAVDFYPVEGATVFEIEREIVSNVTLKHSRTGAFKPYEGTAYIGSKGKVHSGVKGVRLYFKRELGCYRLELELHREALKQYRLSTDFYPLEIDPWQYLEFRRPLSESGFERLFRAVCKKMGIDPTDKSTMRPNMVRNFRMSALKCYDCEREELCRFSSLPFSQPVQCQIDGFRSIKRCFKLTYGVEHFFRKANF
jgi:hypothetical protein